MADEAEPNQIAPKVADELKAYLDSRSLASATTRTAPRIT